jgi:teichuronic acid biosynthesis glycosyltransferase TuaG
MLLGKNVMGQKVSVVMAAYNVESFIHGALSSLESQTRLPDEVVVVDDGSGDGTSDVVKSFMLNASFPVHLIHQKNMGLSATRNVGVAKSSGHIVVFLDSDDTIYPLFLARVVSALDRHHHWQACFSDRDVVKTDGTLISKDLDHPGFREIHTKNVGDSYREVVDEQLFCKMLRGNLIPMTIAIRRSAIETVHGFDEDLRFCEDRMFLLRLIKQTGTLGYASEALGTWVRHDTNQTSDANAEKICECADLVFTRLLADRERLHLSDLEVLEIHRASMELARTWVYEASSRHSPNALKLAFQLLRTRRLSTTEALKAAVRYTLHKQPV